MSGCGRLIMFVFMPPLFNEIRKKKNEEETLEDFPNEKQNLETL